MPRVWISGIFGWAVGSYMRESVNHAGIWPLFLGRVPPLDASVVGCLVVLPGYTSDRCVLVSSRRRCVDSHVSIDARHFLAVRSAYAPGSSLRLCAYHYAQEHRQGPAGCAEIARAFVKIAVCDDSSYVTQVPGVGNTMREVSCVFSRGRSVWPDCACMRICELLNIYARAGLKKRCCDGWDTARPCPNRGDV
jgi:hypothetical protein